MIGSAIDKIQNPQLRQELHAQAMHLMAAAHRSAGWAALAQPRDLVVCHEVGHAIVHTTQGENVVSIAVWKGTPPPELAAAVGEVWAGLTDVPEPESVSTSSPPERIRQFIRRQISGYAGEFELYDGKVPGGSSMDERVVSQLFAARLKVPSVVMTSGWLTPEQVWSGLLSECRRIIKQNETVARQLISAMADRDKIEGDALEPLSRVARL